jgi:PAS domain-containing protein
MGLDEQTVVTATHLVRDFARVRRMAESGPIHISSHGHSDLVVMSENMFSAQEFPENRNLSRIEAKLNVVLETLDSMVVILDRNLCVLRANLAYCSALDVVDSEIRGKPIESLASSLSDRFLIQRMEDVRRTGVSEVFMHPSWQRPGRTLCMKIKQCNDGVALFSEDVTERVQVRDRIGEDISLDHALGALPGVGVAKVRSCGTVLSASTGLARMLGTSEAALVGIRVQQVFDPRCRLVVEDVLTQSSPEPNRCQVEYLRNGTICAKCDLIVTPFWSSEHRQCATIILHDPLLYADSL